MAEHLRRAHALSQLLLHQDEPLQRRLGAADAAGRLEAYRVAGTLVVIADHPGHDDSYWQSGVHRLLAGGSLDEIRDYHERTDRKSTRLNSSHTVISYAVFCLK